MQQVILYYKFVIIDEPEAVRAWQRALAEELNLKGRILISPKGINGTLGGDKSALQTYVQHMSEHPLFSNIVYKWGDGGADDFPKLRVKVRPETVTLGWDPPVNDQGVIGGGQRLGPRQLHQLVQDNPETVFFDARNHFESAIGKFKNAVTPPVENFRELPTELDKPEYASLKDKPVVTYCTGGIRCETLSALMKQKGFKQVYQLDGGIVSYGQQFADDGLWEGKCFVFDRRLAVSFSDQAKDIGECIHCRQLTSRYLNCANKQCNRLILVCQDCQKQTYCQNCQPLAAAV